MNKILTTKMDEILNKQCENVNERYKNFGSAGLVDNKIRIYLKKEIGVLFGQNVIERLNSKAILYHIARWCVLGIVGGGLSEDEVLKFYAQKDFDNMFSSDPRKKTMFKASLASPFNLPTTARQRDEPNFDEQGSFYRQLTSIVKGLSNMHRAAKEQINSKRRKLQDDDDDNDNEDAKEVERNVALTLKHTPVRRSVRNRSDNHIAYTDYPPNKRLKDKNLLGIQKRSHIFISLTVLQFLFDFLCFFLILFLRFKFYLRWRMPGRTSLIVKRMMMILDF